MNSGVLQAAGPVAQTIAGLSWLLFSGGGLIFIGVMVLLAWALRRHGAAPRTRLWILAAECCFRQWCWPRCSCTCCR